MLSRRASYRVACARECLEKAAQAIEEVNSWLDMEDMSQTTDLRYLQSEAMCALSRMVYMDGLMEDLT